MAKVLIVDDHADNRELLAALVRALGHEPLFAGDGSEALTVARRERPRLVISDILMPTMDGYEFVRQLREDPSIARTEVMFHTAFYHDREARALAAACGVSRIMLKPSEPPEMLQAIEAALHGQESPQPPPVAGGFDDRHLRLMTDKLSVKVQELEASNQRLAALTELNLQLASERNPYTLLERVCRGARELLGAKYALLVVGAKDDGETRYWVTGGMDEETETALGTPAMSAGAAGAILLERRAARLQNPGGDPSALGLPPGHPPVRAALIAPIVSLAHSYGWICLSDKIGADGFTADDERVLAVHAAQVGRVYENGSLYSALSRLNRVHAMSSAISGLIVRVGSRAELFEGVTRIAVEVGGFAGAWAGLVDTKPDRLTPTARFPPEPSDPDGVLLRPDDAAEAGLPGLPWLAIRRQEPAVMNDVRGAEAHSGSFAGVRAAAAIPLVAAGAPIAVVVLYATDPGFFDAAEIKLLSELGRDAGFALDHLEQSERVDYLAFYDQLTGLPNRRLFSEHLGVMLATSADRPSVVVVAINVNRMARINQSAGKAGGDLVLKELASRLAGRFADLGAVGRLGGDRFAAAFHGVWDADHLAHRGEEHYAALFEEPIAIDGQDLHISGNLGLAIYPTDGSDADVLISNAEAALGRARLAGERTVLHDAQMNARMEESLALEERLRGALARKEFVLHYQPKVSLESRRVVGLEALIRWQDPGRGLIPPLAFIPMLEETGLILEVGAWALREAVNDRRRWKDAGLCPPRVAVNVSAVQMRSATFVDTIESIVRDDSQPPGIDVEITESVIMDGVEESIRKLQRLRALGVEIAIDDFGTGYSSLAYLTKLPVQKLKIDRAFVNRMLSDPDIMTLSQTIISLAHSLRLTVVAEGVETEEQANILRLLRCDEMQGYLFSRPVPFEGISALLAKES
jgi:diguanylate cyclase (GGDEF)-like protein